MSAHVSSIDIMAAVEEARAYDEHCEVERFEPCELLPIGADVAHFGDAGVLMIATNGDASVIYLRGPWEGTAAEVARLIGEEA